MREELKARKRRKGKKLESGSIGWKEEISFGSRSKESLGWSTWMRLRDQNESLISLSLRRENIKSCLLYLLTDLLCCSFFPSNCRPLLRSISDFTYHSDWWFAIQSDLSNLIFFRLSIRMDLICRSWSWSRRMMCYYFEPHIQTATSSIVLDWLRAIGGSWMIGCCHLMIERRRVE